MVRVVVMVMVIILIMMTPVYAIAAIITAKKNCPTQLTTSVF